jgi:hypothetical protein
MDLNAKNICYTSGLAETKTPRFEGKYPNQAGVFFFLCKKNQAFYYLHTGQKLGIGVAKQVFVQLYRL